MSRKPFVVLLVALLALASCSQPPDDSAKSFALKPDTTTKGTLADRLPPLAEITDVTVEAQPSDASNPALLHLPKEKWPILIDYCQRSTPAVVSLPVPLVCFVQVAGPEDAITFIDVYDHGQSLVLRPHSKDYQQTGAYYEAPVDKAKISELFTGEASTPLK